MKNNTDDDENDIEEILKQMILTICQGEEKKNESKKVVQEIASTSCSQNDKINVPKENDNKDRDSLISLMCRICYDDTLDEPIISICKCKGSVGMVHKSCIERWLAESNTNQCDLCHHRFQTERTTKFSVPESIYRWLRYPPNNFAFPIRDMRNDMITCCILFPFSCFVIYLCLFAANYYNRNQLTLVPIARWTATSVLLMGLIIIVGFCIWIYLVLRYHCRVWYFWWQRETIVRLLELQINERVP